MLQWFTRSRKHQHGRLVTLIDAKAVLSALAKGRTGSSAMRCPVCAISAHLLACDILLRPVYVPSEDMPADGPSRGIRKRPIHRKVLKTHFSKLDRALHRRARVYQRLVDCGMISMSGDSYDSNEISSTGIPDFS